MEGAEFARLALALEGTAEVAHFDRQAFRRRRIYASLAPDGASANLLVSPEEQAHFAERFAGFVAPVANKWGARGWTRLSLPGCEAEVAAILLRAAWSGSA